jgi:8-oxo-dGTP diphosphatase
METCGMNHMFVGAVCALVRRDGRVLALRRSERKDAAPGIWEAVSGRLEPGEDPLEAVHREIREESRLVVRVDPRPWAAFATDRAGVPMLIVYYVADWIAGELRLSEEHSEGRWMDADEFAAASPIPRLVQAVREVLG